jgi:hypothetical protein
MPVAIEAELDPVMDEPLRMHLLADPCPVQKFDRALFEDTGPDAP